jgi:hypothetical protein
LIDIQSALRQYEARFFKLGEAAHENAVPKTLTTFLSATINTHP